MTVPVDHRRKVTAIDPYERNGGDDVGGVSIEGGAGAVVAHRGARVGVRGRLLKVARWDARVQCGGNPNEAGGHGQPASA